MTSAPTKPPPPPVSRNAATRVTQKVAAPKWGKIQPAFQPPRIIVNAVEGWGKTTLAAHTPNPLIVMAAGETGYETLLGSGLVPSVDAAKVATWSETLALVDELIENASGHKTLVFDAMGGFERQCHEHVCLRDFDGDWGERGFSSFQKGYDLAVADWLHLLSRLDRLRDTHGVMVLMLAHSKVKSFKNPMGADFDRYISDVHEKTWAVTAKWADAVFFGNFYTIVEGGKTGDRPKKGKGIGGVDRVLYTERRDAFDAKNRYGMPEVVDIPNDPTQSWSTLWAAIKPQSNGE